MDVVVNSRAWFKKSDLTEEQINFLKTHLTIYPKQYKPDEMELPPKLELFKETATSLGIPRAYFEARKKSHHNVTYDLCDGDPTVFTRYPVSFKGQLREVQKPVFDKMVAHYKEGNLGGFIQCAPGFGKTTLSCALIAEVKKPTLVIVHKEFLMNQWIERLNNFLPQAKIGIVQQDKCDFKNKHVSIAMIHSLVNRDYGADFYNHFGMIVIDEAHHCGSEQWSQIAPKFKVRHRYALSGTPKRSDGAENAFFYHIGPIFVKAMGSMMMPKIRRVYTDFHLVKTEKFNPALLSDAVIMKFLCANVSRNEQIIAQTIEAVKAGRTILVLSKRVKHLKTLQLMFNGAWKKFNPKLPVPTNGLYIGEMKQEDLDKSAKCQIMWATAQLIEEAFDRAELDTMVLATPLGDVTQAVGRILRELPGKKDPIVVDFRDDQVSWCSALAKKRDEVYDRICNPQKYAANNFIAKI